VTFCLFSAVGGHSLQRLVVVQSEAEIEECARVIASSFETVAQDFGLTQENAPTNPAFMTSEKLREYLKKPVVLLGLFLDEAQIGCVAIEKSKREPETFYIERLAVVPMHRHKGYGKSLIDDATEVIRRVGGRKASIGVMNQNKPLIDWYLGQGFVEKECKRFEHLPFEVCFVSKSIAE
jgi:ribosomal protein S18 acetylase RimI-like enzyme